MPLGGITVGGVGHLVRGRARAKVGLRVARFVGGLGHHYCPAK